MKKNGSQLKILLTAPLGSGAYGGSVMKSLQDFGHEVSTVNRRRYFPLSLKPWKRIINRITKKVNCHRYNQEIIRRANRLRPAVMVVMKGVDILSGTLRRIRGANRRLTICNINYDDYFSPASSNTFPDLEGMIPFYDCFFPSKKINISELEELGARRVCYLPLGYDPDVHYPVRPAPPQRRRFGSDLSFIGTYIADRARLLGQLKDYRLAVWGGLWKKHKLDPFLQKSVTGRVVWGEEFSLVANSSKINLNFLREENRDTHNLKSFELPACRAFVLSQRSEELAGFFKEGEEIATFSGVEELRDKAGYYLKRDRERERIARAGYLRLKKDGHTVRDRIRSVLKVCADLRG